MKPIGPLLKDSARFATTLTPWIFVVLGILGKVDFSERWELVGRLAIAWGAVALVGIPFDIVIYALEERLKRKKAEQQADRGSET
ncbi:hypothetical protein H5T55_00780 [Candidatus Bipolaricaulota bacterium]|nr:hypothetical protein [Candidatus Bipolaricaulota bacterium]